mmetsp:Transcript_4385/g.8788  ORF Transcript_4385/g.8788 Transcript_4385/m.8788 type:complete len:84 (-) Transcript_4385:582-833(-)
MMCAGIVNKLATWQNLQIDAAKVVAAPPVRFFAKPTTCAKHKMTSDTASARAMCASLCMHLDQSSGESLGNDVPNDGVNGDRH